MHAPASPTFDDAWALQIHGFRELGSAMYERLAEDLWQNQRDGGLIAEVLGRRPRPLHDAVPLRLLGAVHRLVLAGELPRLGTHYPSVGGAPGASLTSDFLAAVAEHRADIDAGLDRQVQTNEVGRAALLAGGFSTIAERTGRPLRLLELGASAGLNLRWDRFWYDTGSSSTGDPGSTLRFGPLTWAAPPILRPVDVIGRAGCDLSPIDVTDPAARLTLLSFIWPDMTVRFERASAAIAIAMSNPVHLVRADAVAWLTERLAEPAPGVATVVYHSIVWQYLPPQTQAALKDLLRAHGAEATEDRPLAWLRMEPAGPVADLRVTLWPSGEEQVLATASYHGAAISWRAG